MLWARLSGKALKTRFADHRPFVLSHLITGRSNADCRTCLWKMPADARVDELTTAQSEALYRDVAGAGFRALVRWTPSGHDTTTSAASPACSLDWTPG